MRVVFTGIGVISPFGVGHEAFWSGLAAGRSAIRPVDLFDTSALRSHCAGQVSGYEPAELLGSSGLRLLDRTTLLALGAAHLALVDAELDPDDLGGDRMGVVLASMGSIGSRCGFCVDLAQRGPRGINPAAFPNTMVNSPASQVSIRFGITGLSSTLAGGLTASLEALDYAATLIRAGHARQILVGGAMELSEYSFVGAVVSGLTATAVGPQRAERCAPFELSRNGLVSGEGAAVLVLEALDSARARGARIYGELAGSAGGTVVSPAAGSQVESAAQVFARALDDAGVGPDEVDWTAAGANGSIDVDRIEAQALARVLPGVPLATAIKASIGETFCAGGALQTAAALLAMGRGVAPRTVNHQTTDPECPVDCIAERSRPARLERVLVTAVSSLGSNAAVVIRGRPDHRRQHG